MTRLPFPYLTENKSCQNAVSSITPTGVLVSDWAPRTRREVFCLGACLIFDNPPPAGHTKNERRSAPKIGFVRSFFMRLPKPGSMHKSVHPCTIQPQGLRSEPNSCLICKKLRQNVIRTHTLPKKGRRVALSPCRPLYHRRLVFDVGALRAPWRATRRE